MTTVNEANVVNETNAVDSVNKVNAINSVNATNSMNAINSINSPTEADRFLCFNYLYWVVKEYKLLLMQQKT